jgi:hypothetical protein
VRRASSTLTAALVLLGQGERTVHAAPPDRAACVAAYQDAQVSMRRGRLMSARAELGTCLADECPGALRSDCAQWLNEVEARLPSVVLTCEGADGAARADARVSIDGVKVADRLDGTGMKIDPGEHVFRFEVEGEAPLDVRYLVREGDKFQSVVARFSARVERLPSRPVPWTVFALGGLGVAAAGVFVGAGLAGKAGKEDLEGCKPHCTDAAVSSVETKFIVADISLIVSVVSLGAAAYLYFTRGTSPAAPPRAGATAGAPFGAAF